MEELEENLPIGRNSRKHYHDEDTIFVRSTTPTKGLAKSLMAVATKEKKLSVKVRGIGSGAVCQMSKAFIIAKSKLSEKGIVATVDMNFSDVVTDNNETISAIEYKIIFKY